MVIARMALPRQALYGPVVATGGMQVAAAVGSLVDSLMYDIIMLSARRGCGGGDVSSDETVERGEQFFFSRHSAK